MSESLLILLVSKTIGLVVINHTNGLHERVADGRANELETSLE